MTKIECSGLVEAYNRLILQQDEKKRVSGIEVTGRKITDKDYNVLRPFLDAFYEISFFVGKLKLIENSSMRGVVLKLGDDYWVGLSENQLSLLGMLIEMVINQEKIMHVSAKRYYQSGKEDFEEDERKDLTPTGSESEDENQAE